jgi:NAD(P)H-dependent FMN reductase
MTIYEGIGTLPFFHEDVEAAGPPPVVMDLRARLATADAVLIASPEYAHEETLAALKEVLEAMARAVKEQANGE